MGVILLRLLGFAAVMGVALRARPRESIGLWYGMLSLTGLVACIELGFSGTIGRMVSYYYAGATSVPPLGLSGILGPMDGPNVGALDGMVTEARRIYRVLARLYLALSIVATGAWIWLLPSSQPAPDRVVGGAGCAGRRRHVEHVRAILAVGVAGHPRGSPLQHVRGPRFSRRLHHGSLRPLAWRGPGGVGGRADRPKPGRAPAREALRTRLAPRPATGATRARELAHVLADDVARGSGAGVVSIDLAGHTSADHDVFARGSGIVWTRACRRR